MRNFAAMRSSRVPETSLRGIRAGVSAGTKTVDARVDSTPAVHSTERLLPMRMLRLPEVMQMTGLRKTKIYELQSQGDFPMRVKITSHSVGWIEEDVQAWLAMRVETNTLLPS